MKYLLSAFGEATLDKFLAQLTLLAFDFDGTLAPIVSQPQAARIPAGTLQLLAALCAARPVAIISGRSVDDLRTRIGAAPKYLIGNHGLEGIPDHQLQVGAYQAICRGWRDQLSAPLAEPVLAGVMLEDKGYSLSLHYRLVSQPAAAAQRLRALLATLQPAPAIIGGKHVFNLIPAGPGNKRQALQALLRRENLDQALYVGDDDTDEAIFSDAPPSWLTVRVEPSPHSDARFFLRRQDEMATLLERIRRTTIPSGRRARSPKNERT